jgi:hypothetical protein
MKLSICVTHKNRSKVPSDRGVLHLFPDVVESIARSVGDVEVELVVTDWMSTDWPIREWIYDKSQGKFDIKIVDVKEKWFSRGKGLNLAAENAKHDIIFFTDTDVVMTEKVIRDAVAQCSAGKAFYPICRHDVDHSDHDGWMDCGYGLCAVTKKMWIKAGKWQEWSSWGGEDDAFFYGVRDHFSIHRHRYEGFLHLDHPKPMNIYERKTKYADYKEFMQDRKGKKRKHTRTDRHARADRKTIRTLRIRRRKKL